MRLLLVEVDRLWSRRAVVLLVLAAALLTALLAATAVWDTRPVSASGRAAAEVQATNAAADPLFEKDLAQCREDPASFLGSDAVPDDCDQVLTPKPEDFLPRATLDLGKVVENRGVAVILLVTALLIIAGATFAGGDWATGSISNQLLFRPRRLEVWVAKAGAVVVSALVVAAVVVGGFWLALYLTTESRGIVTPPAVLHDIGWTAGRGVLLAAAGALGGYALTMLLGSTVGTLAVLFAYAVVGEALVAMLPVERASQWSLSNNVFAWIDNGTTVFDPDRVCPPGQGGCIQSYVLGLGHSVLYLGVLLLAAVAVSAVTFRRRDIP
jgi:hypothetical protein